MNDLRRRLLKGTGAAAMLGAALAAGLGAPVRALAAVWNKDAFGAKSAKDALASLGASNAVQSKDISIDASEIAENGAVVPIEVMSNIPGTRSIAVVIEKNPFPLASRFDFTDDAVPFVKLNVKIGESSFVRVVAEAGGKHYFASREIKVTIGGCGG